MGEPLGSSRVMRRARRDRDDVLWRTAVLRGAGLSRREARAIAGNGAVDVHELVSLLERGYALQRALRLLDDRAGAA